MKRVNQHSRGRTLVTYLGMTALLGFTAMTTDVALGYLTNAQAYLRIQSPASAHAPALAASGHASAYALSDTRAPGRSGNP